MLSPTQAESRSHAGRRLLTNSCGQLLLITCLCLGWQIQSVHAQPPDAGSQDQAAPAAPHEFLVRFHDGRLVSCNLVSLHHSGRQLVLYSKREGIEFSWSVSLEEVEAVCLGQQTVTISRSPSERPRATALDHGGSAASGSGVPIPLIQESPAADAARLPATTQAWYADPFDPCRLWPSTRSVMIGRLPAPLATYAHLLPETFPIGIAPAESAFARELLRQRVWHQMLVPTVTGPLFDDQQLETPGSSPADLVAPPSAPQSEPTHVPVPSPPPPRAPLPLGLSTLGQPAIAAATSRLPGRADLSAVQVQIDGTSLVSRHGPLRGIIHFELWGTRDSLLPTGDRNLYSHSGRGERVAAWTRHVNFAESPLQQFQLPMQSVEQRWEYGPNGHLQVQIVIPGRPVEQLVTEVQLRDLSITRVERLMQTGYLFSDHQQTDQRRPVPVRFRPTTSLRSHPIPGFVADGH